MSKRYIGVVFCILATVVLITKYVIYSMIISAIVSTGVYSWSNVIDDTQPYIGVPLTAASTLLFLLGISFIIYTEAITIRESRTKKNLQ